MILLLHPIYCLLYILLLFFGWYQGGGGGAEPFVDVGGLGDHVPQGVVVRGPVEGVAGRDHLVHQQPHTPPVHAVVVA